MKKLLATPLLAIGLLVGALTQACTPPPAPPSNLMLGDSVAAYVGDKLPDTDNQAVGGTTACDTADNLPLVSPKRMVLHVGGHSWGNYDEATWQSCTLRIIDTFLNRGSQVYVATAPLPGAIYCANPFYVALAEAQGNPHTSGDIGFELRQRLYNANNWKVNVLPTLRPKVKVLRWEGVQHYGDPDCIHPTPAGVDDAVARTQAAF